MRIAYEPTRSVPGGCEIENSPVINGSYVDVEVLVQSRVDILLVNSGHVQRGTR